MNKNILVIIPVLFFFTALILPVSAQPIDCKKEQNYYLAIVAAPQSSYPDNIHEVLVRLIQEQGYVKEGDNLKREGVNCFISMPVSVADTRIGLAVFFYSNSPNGFPVQELENLQMALSNGLKSLNYNNLRVWIMRRSETL